MLTAEERSEIKQLIAETVQDAFAQAWADQRFKSPDAVVDVTARATQVFGTADKAIRWLKCPVRALGGQTPLSLLGTEEGVTRVMDVLGQVEHGVW